MGWMEKGDDFNWLRSFVDLAKLLKDFINFFAQLLKRLRSLHWQNLSFVRSCSLMRWTLFDIFSIDAKIHLLCSLNEKTTGNVEKTESLANKSWNVKQRSGNFRFGRLDYGCIEIFSNIFNYVLWPLCFYPPPPSFPLWKMSKVYSINFVVSFVDWA